MAGHSTNDQGIVLDLSGLNHVSVPNPATGVVRAQAGAIWGDVAAELTKHDLVLTSGNFGDTGVGGLATTGGIGYFVRSQGLTLDHVIGARVVTADGSIRAVDADHNPDLFWAIRGGGAQVGIVTELTMTAVHLDDTHVIHQSVQHVTSDLAKFTEDWGRLLQTAPREFTSFLMIRSLGDGRFLADATNVWADTDTTTALVMLQRYLELAPVHSQSASIAPYATLIPTPRWPHTGQQNAHIRSGLVNNVDRSLGTALARVLEHPLMAVAELRSLGGALNDVPRDSTAWAHRDHQAFIAVLASPAPMDEIDEAWAPLAASTHGMYSAYTADIRAERRHDAWPGATGARLRQLAETYDPDGLFNAGLVARLPFATGDPSATHGNNDGI